MADRDALAQFLSHAASDENVEQFDVLGFLQELKLPVAQVEAGQLFVAKRGGAIIGLASVVYRHDSDIEIDAMLVDPTADRVRVGDQLAEAAADFGRKAGAAGVHVLAIESAKPDLESIGTHRARRRRLDRSGGRAASAERHLKEEGMGGRINPADVPAVVGTRYPLPFDEPCRARERKRLGEAAGLTQYGVNLLRLPPGTWSSQRHWHSLEDEFVYVLSGEVTLVSDDGDDVKPPRFGPLFLPFSRLSPGLVLSC